jgi:predicted O-methyltransferase YrrM
MFGRMGFSVGAEIGVCAGKFSRDILSLMPNVTLYSVDRWLLSSGEFARQLYEEAVGNLREFGCRSKIVIGSSPAVSSEFADGSLDFAYIDADHLYESAAKDLEAWWPKIRSGGILSGHDYKNGGNAGTRRLSVSGERTENSAGVKRAVDEFAARMSLQVHLTKDRPRSFWAVKP